MCVNLQKYSNQFLTTARFVFRLPSAVVRTDKGTTRHEGADESSRPAQHGSARFCDMGRTLYDVLVLPTEAALADFCQSLRLKRAGERTPVRGSCSNSLPQHCARFFGSPQADPSFTIQCCSTQAEDATLAI
ncbi:hypothetical protein WJX74_000108 [Apatococcus lobatus]|uniref:Uncharacterized protein n=1 Tax=Apatococcus lobatus TaxID=904363 RepID=A0AAW1QVG4_9CHLO